MKPIRTMDFETDPFLHGRRVFPFACGLYDGQNFISIWSRQCAAKIVKALDKLEPSIIYMHNGGRFDIFYLLKYLDAEMRIINGRVVQCYLGAHEIRDSYAILPMALSQYKKDEIDIQKLSVERRQENKDEILSYLRGDCVYLHELVTAFLTEFGDYLTIGSAAMGQLRKFHPFENGNKYLDDKFRKQFFFGGRVQCFQSGVISGPFKIYDVNSMYPYVMKNYRHPIGNSFEVDRRVRKNTAFIVVEGIQCGPYGVFPMRNKRGGIDFDLPRGVFCCSIHEWETALILEWFKPIRILKTYGFDTFMCFDEFVDHFYGARMKAKVEGDLLRLIFYKLILNSAYGKFAQNPDNFCDFAITHGERMPTLCGENQWREHFIHNEGDYVIWKKNVQRHSYYNVAVGASITGAARSVLLDGLYGSDNLIYCDTDSVICRNLTGVAFSDTELGAWKLESSGDRIAIAGKKLYACFDGNKCVKKATKGARISEIEIVDVARGGTAIYRKDAPTFKLDGRVDFIERRIRRTV